MTSRIQLDPEAQEFIENAEKAPYPFNLDPEKRRLALEVLQAVSVNRPLVEIGDLRIKDGPSDTVKIRILRPPNLLGKLPAIVYLHGGGWVVGSESTHDRLIREIAVGARAAVIFPSYSRSPEAKYPTALEECYSVVKWVGCCGGDFGLEPACIAVAGDSVGGNLATALTILSKERGGPGIQCQLLFYPVTDASFDTASYHQFAEGYHLRRDAMLWFWDQYTTQAGERSQITASPLRAGPAQLNGLPPALVITAEADVVRDEGEAYAGKLRQAGVRVSAVRFLGTIHDFMMLDRLAGSPAARGALTLAISWLRDSLAEA
jgi:acetyl esterase